MPFRGTFAFFLYSTVLFLMSSEFIITFLSLASNNTCKMSTMTSRESPGCNSQRDKQNLRTISRLLLDDGFSYRRNVNSLMGKSREIVLGIAYLSSSVFKSFWLDLKNIRITKLLYARTPEEIP